MPALKPPQRNGNRDPEQNKQRQSNAVMTVELHLGQQIAQSHTNESTRRKSEDRR